MDQRIEIDIIIMRREAHRNLQIREVAQRVNLSLGHFIRLFKAQTDISPKGYLRRLKIEKAQELLNKTFMSIKEIAANVGFGDRSHAEPKQFFRGSTQETKSVSASKVAGLKLAHVIECTDPLRIGPPHWMNSPKDSSRGWTMPDLKIRRRSTTEVPPFAVPIPM